MQTTREQPKRGSMRGSMRGSKSKNLLAALLLGVTTAGVPLSAHAVDLLSLGSDLSALTSTGMSDLIQLAGIGLDHRPYAPAGKMGGWAGLELGADISLSAVPANVQALLTLIAGSSATSLPVIHISLRKGFGPVALGFSMFTFGGITSIGGDLQWTLISKPAMPSLAVRGGFSNSSVWFLSATTFSGDVIGSYGLGSVLEPYVGLGVQAGSGSITLTTQTLPAGVSASSGFFAPRFFGGLQIKLFVLKIVPEFTYSFAGLTTYGARVALSI